MHSFPSKMMLAAALLGVAACQGADVGGVCTMKWGSEPFPDASCAGTEGGHACYSVTADYFETGSTDCENLECILSPVSSGSKYDRAPLQGYCSKPCSSNDDCYESDTGLICRQVVLDSDFLNGLDQATKDRYLGQVQTSYHCAVKLK